MEQKPLGEVLATLGDRFGFSKYSYAVAYYEVADDASVHVWRRYHDQDINALSALGSVRMGPCGELVVSSDSGRDGAELGLLVEARLLGCYEAVVDIRAGLIQRGHDVPQGYYPEPALPFLDEPATIDLEVLESHLTQEIAGLAEWALFMPDVCGGGFVPSPALVGLYGPVLQTDCPVWLVRLQVGSQQLVGTISTVLGKLTSVDEVIQVRSVLESYEEALVQLGRAALWKALPAGGSEPTWPERIAVVNNAIATALPGLAPELVVVPEHLVLPVGRWKEPQPLGEGQRAQIGRALGAGGDRRVVTVGYSQSQGIFGLGGLASVAMQDVSWYSLLEAVLHEVAHERTRDEAEAHGPKFLLEYSRLLREYRKSLGGNAGIYMAKTVIHRWNGLGESVYQELERLWNELLIEA